MNTNELADKLAEQLDITKTNAKATIEAVFGAIVDAVNKGEEVSLNGVGKFALKETPEREGRNPSTGETITIKAQRKISFAPAKAVKDKLNA